MGGYTYPGVYVEEIASGVHTISGVATSIAAFVGWAAQGPTNQATLVQSWTDFQTQFGGLDSRSRLGYAVNQFFANGGQQAYIVRVVWDGTLKPATGTPTACATATATVGGTLTLWANSPGIWGNNLQITVTPQTATPTRFSLTVEQLVSGSTVVLESFFNLSASSTDPEYVVTVIDNDSGYISFVDPATGVAPSSISGAPTAASGVALAGGLDGSTLNPLDGVLGDGNFEIALTGSPTAGKM